MASYLYWFPLHATDDSTQVALTEVPKVAVVQVGRIGLGFPDFSVRVLQEVCQHYFSDVFCQCALSQLSVLP